MTRPPLRAVRRAVQIGVALVMAAVPLANAKGVHWISGNFLALDVLGLPLGDPLAVAQVAASARAVAWPAALGAGLALVLALALGPVFCAYACPYGLLSEWAHALSRRLGRARPGRFPRGGLAARTLLAGIGLAAVGVLGLPPLLNLLSLPAAYSRLWQHAASGLFWLPVLAVPALLLVEALCGARLWCRFVCPQSVLLALVHRLAAHGLRLAFEAKRCTCGRDDRACLTACSLDLDPRRKTPSAACTNCGDCVEACRRRGRALGFSLGPRRENPGESGSTRPAGGL
ncbi:4Fe-4S binding protein [Solidesulfovibrio sp.]|uniref:4Fe-4S binding protein n=1 Tax=Solidesulfovibrio sp. TaxID=2910990 RepID=UPI00260BF9AC|nr:4Fe-4S binding protein [Solidesulfovibrio sp.]